MTDAPKDDHTEASPVPADLIVVDPAVNAQSETVQAAPDQAATVEATMDATAADDAVPDQAAMEAATMDATAADDAVPDQVEMDAPVTAEAASDQPESAPSETEQERVEREADRQAGAMGASLRQDVAAWAAGREGASARANAALNPPIDTQEAAAAPVKRAAPRVRKTAATREAEATAAKAVKKPFSMSYSGVTTAQHIQSMIDRGAR